MAIDESAGVLARRDPVFKSAAQSYVMALGLARPSGFEHPSLHTRTVKALIERGLVESRPRMDIGRWATRLYLTAEGRMAAEASPAVREWLDGWDHQRRTP